MANTNWENLPSTNTPINATNLNKTSAGLVNVGTSVDSSYRTNILHSKNLFDKNNATITNAYFDSSTGALISGGGSYVTENYTEVNANTTYIVGNVSLSRVVFYNSSKGVISVATTSTSFTTPANTKYIRIQMTTNTRDIIIQEGSSIIIPSIVVDNEEIYNKDQYAYKVLWENNSPSSSFGATTITLNENISNYEYYEVIFRYSKSNNRYKSSGKVRTNTCAYLDLVAFANFCRIITSISGTSIIFENAKYSQTYGSDPTTENSNYIIPIQVIGYK